MKVFFVVNVDWFFVSHRLPIALAAVHAGHEVHIATTLTQGSERLEAYGFIVHAIRVDRSGAGLWGLAGLAFGLIRLFWRVKPDVVHLVTIKPVLIGGLAARFSPVGGVVYAVSGLGHVFVADGLLGKLRRRLVGLWYRFVLGARNMRIIFQNPDDRRAIESVARLNVAQVVMIPGSGVDLSKYRNTPLPEGGAIVLMAARLLGTKGVREFVSAARQLREARVAARFWLIGVPDPANPASIQSDELSMWAQQGDVELFGYRSDIPDLMAQAHMVVLPSYYGEGLPKVLIEAAACSRAVVTTDMPGCRDSIEAGVTGLLVPPKDVEALAEAIRSLVEDRLVCEAMGREGRTRAEQVFDVNAVVNTHLAIYRSLGQPG